jgi:CheY-like chemotaxis protein
VTAVLFVDDERQLLDGLRRSLWCRRGEWEMAFEDNGPAALGYLADHQVDVVVSDFRMPGMDGGEFLQMVQRQSPDSVRLVLSGHTEERDLLGLVGVAHQFLLKPCPPQELAGLIDRMLTIRRGLGAGSLRGPMTAIGSLPCSAPTLEQLEQLTADPATGSETITLTLEQDVALAVTVYQIANSSFFAPAARTTSLGAAVRRLGPGPIRGLAQELLRSGDRIGAPDRSRATRLHEHARDAAARARSEHRNGSGRPDDAACAALLHVTGPLAVAGCRDRRLPCSPGPDDTAQAGGYLLRLWGIPDEVVAAATTTALECEECAR